MTPEALLANAAWVRALARRLVRDDDLADDLVQDAWVAALEHPPRIAGAERSWLGTVVRNFALLARRGDANRERRERRAAKAEALPSTADMVERASLQHLVVEEVLALSEPARSTVLLHFFEGVSSEEIARRLGLPGSTVRGRLMRALDELRARLDRRYGGDRTVWFGALAPLAVGSRAGETVVSSTVKGVIVAHGIGKTAAAVALGIVLAAGLIGGLWFVVAREPTEHAALPPRAEIARTTMPEAPLEPAIETAASSSPPASDEKSTAVELPAKRTPPGPSTLIDESTPPPVEPSSRHFGDPVAARGVRYEVVAVPDGGTIFGKVTFAGTPEVIKLKTTKDRATCHDEKDSPRLVVGSRGGVANAIVYLENIPKGKGIDDMPAGMLDQKDCEYVPHVQVVPWNKEFVIKSSDPVLHNVHMNYKDNDQPIANIPFPEPGQTKKKFKRPGLAYTKCDAGHLWMSAYVFAADNPYVVVTDSDGHFTITDVPPGKYKVGMWHEGYDLKETPMDSSGNPTGFVWSDDVADTEYATVEARKFTMVNFSLR
ncbi:MAG: sigma-70 family RNA polymerase sigma factor [Planctomycetes bacterium]|nr:sigma-70 family RNA polymerase sigma factor [Planctomycetota bacterium]MBI3845020.1 sigma-70 family RNA polymerase sigma factor [Planctomycetota bacterium]